MKSECRKGICKRCIDSIKERINQFKERMKEYGYSSIFCRIILWAMKKKFDYIRFDAEGPIYKEFKVPKEVSEK